MMRPPFTGQPSEGGIFMKYSYEYKRQCVTLYRQGSWPLTPKGVQPQHFRDMIRRWANSVSCENICRVFYPFRGMPSWDKYGNVVHMGSKV